MKEFLLTKILLLNLFAIVAYSQSTPSMADLVEGLHPSVLSITAYDRSGERIGNGTGFVVATNRVLTNYHVVANAERVELRSSEGIYQGMASPIIQEQNADLALLQCQLINSSLKPLRLTSSRPRVGEKVFVLGNPLGLFGTVTDGIVSAFRAAGKMGTLVQITAPISPGSSGSPVFNMNGQVIGMATLYVKGGQNLNFAVASESLISFASLGDSGGSSTKGNQTSGQRRWRLLDENMSYDAETITKKLGFMLVWIRYDDQSGTYSKVLTEIDCNSKRIRSVKSFFYENPSEPPTAPAANSEWSPVVPESKGEVAYGVLCRNGQDYQSGVDWRRYMELVRTGNSLQLERKYDEAVQVFGKIITDIPEYAAWGFRAIAGIKLAQGNIRAAKNAALEAIKLDPADPSAHSTLGDVYKQEGQLRAAVGAYWKALRIGSEEFNRYGRFGVILDLKGIYEKQENYVALTNLLNFAIKNGHALLYDDLAKVYENRNMPSQGREARLSGIRYYERQINNRRGQSSISDYLNLSELLEGISDHKRVQSTLIEAINLFPTDWILVNRLATNYNKNRNWNKSVELIEQALPRMKDTGDKRQLLYALKKTYLHTGDGVKAAQIDRRIADLPTTDRIVIFQ